MHEGLGGGQGRQRCNPKSPQAFLFYRYNALIVADCSQVLGKPNGDRAACELDNHFNYFKNNNNAFWLLFAVSGKLRTGKMRTGQIADLFWVHH
jgi:hypothetical protein